MMSPEASLWPRGRNRSSPRTYTSRSAMLCASFSFILLTGCPNKTPVANTPAPPPPSAPVATLEVNPATVQQGEQVTLTWKTENAVEVSLAPLGTVQPNGSQTVSPTESTTYTLTAKGPGGVQESSARVTVASAAVESPSTLEGMNFDTVASAGRLDIFFDSDDSTIRPDQLGTIKNDVDFLKRHPEVNILIEGHCDEAGSAEYNLALGDARAAEVKAAFEKAGVSVARMETISYGKEKPFCEEQTEECWRRNRRAHISPRIER